MSANRDKSGKFAKGQSGNPGGVFAKGQSGNPGGRPKDSISLVTILRQALTETDKKSKKTRARQIIDALILESIGGNVKAIEHIIERIDGPVGKLASDATTEATDDISTLRDYLDKHQSRPGPGADR